MTDATSISLTLIEPVSSDHYTDDEIEALGERWRESFWMVSFRVRVGRDAFPLRVLVARDELEDEAEIITYARGRARIMLRGALEAATERSPSRS